MPRLQGLYYTAALCLAGAGLADEPSPPNVTIATKLAVKGSSYVHLQNRESKSIILELSPGPVSSVQFASKRATLKPGEAVDINLGNLGFRPGRQTLHIISKLFDAQNAPAGMGPFLLESLIVSAKEIRKVSDEDASQSQTRPTSSVGGALVARPGSQEITRGAEAEFPIAISPSSGSSVEVRLSVRDLPQGATASFTPNPATRTSRLMVNVTKDTKPGAYTLIVDGVSGDLTWTTNVSLVVR